MTSDSLIFIVGAAEVADGSGFSMHEKADQVELKLITAFWKILLRKIAGCGVFYYIFIVSVCLPKVKVPHLFSQSFAFSQ